ncbi:GNAT family N-acetyltransferase [Duganella sp. CY15W]|uniref:GNAT family N-acetyltransferase n=1 Tax=Duganella sp. CY15W TaxID=2692172 RepID=UPI001371659F|nr:GNAT family N-acetyltransferase [Duganella sp. CY15W]MYM32046.1 GNAT family N-acetyltransferase [Duganella sp. CY15W]
MPIAFETPDQHDVHVLIAELDIYLLERYPPEAVYALNVQELLQPNIQFAVARSDDGNVVGCCAVVLTPDYAEIKRMYVRPAARGTGMGRQLMGALEQAARSAGCPQMVLETGPEQPEALALYERHGFERCGPYGDYPDDPHSVFMRKALN